MLCVNDCEIFSGVIPGQVAQRVSLTTSFRFFQCNKVGLFYNQPLDLVRWPDFFFGSFLVNRKAFARNVAFLFTFQGQNLLFKDCPKILLDFGGPFVPNCSAVMLTMILDVVFYQRPRSTCPFQDPVYILNKLLTHGFLWGPLDCWLAQWSLSTDGLCRHFCHMTVQCSCHLSIAWVVDLRSVWLGCSSLNPLRAPLGVFFHYEFCCLGSSVIYYY